MAEEVRQAEKQLRAERRAAASSLAAERRIERDVRKRARQQAATERKQAQAGEAAAREIGSRRPPRTEYEAWLDERDAREPLTRADLRSENDEIAEAVIDKGGGIQDVIDATDLRTLENVTGLIDPAILERAYNNDHLRRTTQPPPER